MAGRWSRRFADQHFGHDLPRSDVKAPSGRHSSEQWAKKLEAVTNDALATVSGKSRARRPLPGIDMNDIRTDDPSVEDAARALLDQWMHDKVHMDCLPECLAQSPREDWGPPPTGDEASCSLARIEQQLACMSGVSDGNAPGIGPTSGSVATAEDDRHGDGRVVSALDLKLEELEEKYELLTVDKILDNIVNKQFDDNKHVLSNLGFGRKNGRGSDMATKMDLRQKEIAARKAQRVKKQLEAEERARCCTETENAAKKLILEEEKERLAKKAEEERRLREDMERIRKEVREQQQLMKEQLMQESQLKQAAAEKQKLEQQSRAQQQALEKMRLTRAREEKRRREVQLLEQVKVRQMRVELQCLHRHFSAWYDLVLEQRLLAGKAIALFEWRLLSRTWYCWKNAAVQRTLQRDALRHSEHMRRALVRDQVASHHNQRRLLSRCFRSWSLFVALAKEEKAAEAESELRKLRLQSFLAAAENGNLWKEEDTEDELSGPAEVKGDSLVGSTCRSKFPRAAPSPAVTSARVNRMYESNSSSAGGSGSAPREPWQVRRYHVHDMTLEQLQQLGQSTKKAISDTARQLHIKMSEKQLEQTRQLEQQQKQLQSQQKMIQQLQKRMLETDKDRSGRTAVSEQSPPASNVESLCRATGECGSTPSGGSETKRSDRGRDKKMLSAVPRDPIVEAMEERERLRQEKRAQLEAARRQKEKERMEVLRQQQQEAEAALLREKKAAAEKRRQEQLEQQRLEKRRLEQQAALGAALAKAARFDTYRLLKYYGMAGWKKLVAIAADNHVKSARFHERTVCGKCFRAWRAEAAETATLKREMADELWRYLVVRRSFNSWRRFREIMAIETVKADRHHRAALKRRVMAAWLQFADQRRTHNVMNSELAEGHNEQRLLRWCFRSWRRLPEMSRCEAERLKRRSELRSLVSEILPDFNVPAAATAAAPKQSSESDSESGSEETLSEVQ